VRHAPPERTESQARRASALRSALGPLTTFLDDPRVVEVMLNADGVVWVDKIGEGMIRTPVVMPAADAERMLRLVASEVLVELNPQSPSLSAKLPPPWGARLQAAIPPIVDAPVFALRKPAGIVFSLEDYVSRGILTAAQRDALEFAVLAHDNILIGGGTGSGILRPLRECRSHGRLVSRGARLVAPRDVPALRGPALLLSRFPRGRGDAPP
jgi:type IV secretion system protein TrbB